MSIALNKHLIKYCKDKGMELIKRGNWYIVPLKNVEEVKAEIKRFKNE
jgi:hypothetical protein